MDFSDNIGDVGDDGGRASEDSSGHETNKNWKGELHCNFDRLSINEA